MVSYFIAGDKELKEISIGKVNVEKQLQDEHNKVLSLINEKGIDNFKDSCLYFIS